MTMTLNMSSSEICVTSNLAIWIFIIMEPMSLNQYSTYNDAPLVEAEYPVANRIPHYILLLFFLPASPMSLASSRSTYFWTLPVDNLSRPARKATALGTM
jgi:hypothetical protein